MGKLRQTESYMYTLARQRLAPRRPEIHYALMESTQKGRDDHQREARSKVPGSDCLTGSRLVESTMNGRNDGKISGWKIFRGRRLSRREDARMDSDDDDIAWVGRSNFRSPS